MNDLVSWYWISFIITSLLCVILQLFSRNIFNSSNNNIYFVMNSDGENNKSIINYERFSEFQTNYLIVYLLAMFADWLQGPYVYELYESYGFSEEEIAQFFVCGFASSMIFGTIAGGLADKLGRKCMCIAYAMFYITACITKLFPQYWSLMLGRALSGVSTSLLFSVFESWMVCEHYKKGYDSVLLAETFAYGTFGNGLAGVFGGLVANGVATSYGFVAPFVVAILPLSLVGFIVFTQWSENYGDQNQDIYFSLNNGFHFIRQNYRIAALGLSQSLFEGGMYTFIFMWTPALHPKAVSRDNNNNNNKTNSNDVEDVTSQYLGLIFAVFMTCSMIGSSIFQIYGNKKRFIYIIPIIVHTVAFLSMLIIALFFDTKVIVYLMFLLFEITVGMFYPSYGIIKSEKIPENIRSSVMNIFRIPLNLFVVLLLIKIHYLSFEMIFTICSLAHLLSLIFYLVFYIDPTSLSWSRDYQALEN